MEDAGSLRMAALPPEPVDARSAAQARGRYFNSANAFNVVHPEVPACSFAAPPAMLGGTAATGWHLCDQSGALGLSTPATSPLVLARYGALQPGDSLVADFAASGTICYVIAGSGHSEAGETLNWKAGDILFFPGAGRVRHVAAAEGALLWVVTDEPLLGFAGLRKVDSSVTGSAPVHYPSDEIARQLTLLQDAQPEARTSGCAVVFSTQELQASRNILPVLTLSLNTLAAGQAQRAHRHNSVAVTLVVQGEHCHSDVAGQCCAWAPWSTMVTPPGALHSHHNDGGRRADFLIVQDGGLHYHARTMQFEFC